MPTYRVGVLLTASGGSFQRGMRAAAGTTRQTQSALQRAGGAATAFGRRSNEAGRQAQSALQRASGSVRGLQSALQRTSNQARQTGSAIDAAAGRSGRKVRGLIQRFRELGRAIRESRAGAQGGGALGGGAFGGGALGGGALARAAGAVGGGFAFSRAAGQEMDYEVLLESLGTDAGKSPEEMLQLRRHIEAIAGREGIRIPVRELAAALDQYYRLASDFDQGVQNLEVFAEGIQRSQASGRDFATLAVQFRKFGLASTDELREAVVTAIEAQRQGSFYVADIAAAGGRSMSRWSAVRGQQGRDALADYLALGQVSMAAAGGQREIAATQLQALVAAFTDKTKLRQMEKLGVYGAAERSPSKVLNELIGAVGGRSEELSPFFGDEAMGLVTFLLTPEGQRKYRDSVAAVSEIGAEQFSRFESDTARMADTSRAKLQVAQDRAQSLYSRALGGTIQALITQAAAHQDAIMTGSLAVLGGRTLWRGGRGALDWWRRRGAGDDGRGDPRGGRGSRGGSGMVRTMHVTTLIAGRTVGGGLAGAAGRNTGAARRAGGGGFFARAAGRAGGLAQRAGGLLRRVPVVGLALGGAGIAASVAQGDRTGAAVQAGGLAGGAGGAALGSAVGSALGSIVVPGLGTAIGAGIGSVLGGYFGANFGADQTASALERAAGMDAETRDSRRAKARRRWMEGDVDGGGDGAVEPAAPELGRDELRRLMREDFMAARGGQVNSNNTTRTVHIDSPVFQVRSDTGDPVEIGDALFQQLMERVREELRHDEERTVDFTYSDPDPTLLF